MSLYDAMADSKQLRRGKVWCHECGRWRYVDSAVCLRLGWPKCCGYTMSVDSPHERNASSAPRDDKGRFSAIKPNGDQPQSVPLEER